MPVERQKCLLCFVYWQPCIVAALCWLPVGSAIFEPVLEQLPIFVVAVVVRLICYRRLHYLTWESPFLQGICLARIEDGTVVGCCTLLPQGYSQ